MWMVGAALAHQVKHLDLRREDHFPALTHSG